MSFKDIFTKEELIANNWQFAYIEIGVKWYRQDNCPTPNFIQIEKLPLGLSNEAYYDIARAYVKRVFELHPERNIEDFYAFVDAGESTKSCLQDISIYHLFK